MSRPEGTPSPMLDLCVRQARQARQVLSWLPSPSGTSSWGRYWSCGTPIVMVQAAQDGGGHDGCRRSMRCALLFRCIGDSLPYPLMRPGFVTARRIRPEHAPQLFFVQDEEVVEAHAPNAADKPLADGVRVGCSNGRAQHLDAAPRRDTGERRPIPGVVVADRDARRPTERRGLAHLLGDPGVGRVSRHADLDDPPRAEIDDKEGEERAEAQVDDRQEVTRPDVMSVVMQERRPRLALWARRAHAADALRPPICRFSSAIRLINATVAADTCGLFRAVADRTCQTRRYPWRCQRNSVSGWTMSSAARQPCARRARSASATRSRGVNAGRLTWRCSTISCCRRSAFSATNAALLIATLATAPRTGVLVAGLVHRRKRCVR